jgi:hypothetical protein
VQPNAKQVSMLMTVLFKGSPVQEVGDTGENLTKSHSECNVYTRQALVELDTLRFKTLCKLQGDYQLEKQAVFCLLVNCKKICIIHAHYELVLTKIIR